MIAELRAAAAFGPYFTVGLVEQAEPGAATLSTLYGGGPELGKLIGETGTALGGVEDRVAASTWHLAYCAYIWSPVLACTPAPVFAPERTWWAAGETPRLRVLGDVPAGELSDVMTLHFAPMVRAVRSVVRVAEPLLWGNVASAAVGALRVCGGSRARLSQVLALPELSGALDSRLVRRSCCLFYRVPGGGYCGDCPLPK
jgi:hypothetical protein